MPGRIEINPNIDHVTKDCVRNQVKKSGGMADNCNARVNQTNAIFSNLFSSVALTNQFGVFPNHKIAPCVIVVVANSSLFNADSCK